ncbi:MAG: single-stranded-DNA-specific exonuclease RecJ [Clostridiales Family XIII bacterium]|jgi:single-stranded-DNA-specific exonuclease|nr:single-stranded-DNA-specific exonuclease RecJ [Clostridiales Family XIII bacterium]
MTSADSAVLRILERRGMTASGDIEEFLSDRPKRTHDPFLLRNMEEGVEFILSAARRGRRICVYGDYDVDGITAAAALVQALSLIAADVGWYIPSRFDEGYGLNREALKSIADAGWQTVVTVDCGSVSPDEVAYGRSIGLDIMVTDHHNAKGREADCIIINPKQEGDSYPFDELSGCGVVFKLLQAMQRKGLLPKSLLSDVLDLVGIATIADIVPLVDENRTITKYGLRAVGSTRRPGLRRLLERTGLADKEIGTRAVAYSIAPHINAAGRMGEAHEVVELLLTHDTGRIESITETLVAQNARRRTIQAEALDFCVGIVEGKGRRSGLGDAPFYVIDAGDAHEGITGIVAGKLREVYGRPVIILTKSQGRDGRPCLKGTGRSIPGVDIYAMLERHVAAFEKFGGHSMACGFLMHAEYEDELRAGLIAEMEAIMASNPGAMDQTRAPDIALDLSDITPGLVSELDRMAPFGRGNPQPLIELSRMKVAKLFFMGEKQQHLKIVSENLDIVVFGNAAAYSPGLRKGVEVSALGYPSVAVWKGRERVQFIAEAVKAI